MTVLLVDGRSGSGKTEFATALAAAWPDAQVVRLDDIYPGWEGLERGIEHVREFVLASDSPRWRRWDWLAGEPAEWHELDPARPLIVEGVGALASTNRELADFGIWVALDEDTRKARALARDAYYAPHWDAWAEQELRYLERENPAQAADAVIDGRVATAGVERWRDLLRGARVGE